MAPYPEPSLPPALQPATLADILAARARIASTAVRTPLVRIRTDSPAEIWLKLETLQPINSFKLRGALSAMRALPPDQLRDGVYTASAGNMAQGLAWAAREIGVSCRVIAPDHAPQTKIDAITRLGASVRRVPFAEWWQVLLDGGVAGERGTFIHPGADAAVIAGNATIGLEILEQLPDVETILVPYGSGGLACGIACAARAMAPWVKVYAVEVETAAPFAASLAAGRPVTVEYTPSFVDGMGGKSVLDQMWPLARSVLAGSLVVSLRQVADAVRMIAEHTRVISEGAGAAPLAAALAHVADGQRVACVVSGGNIDFGKLASILAGAVP